ncbi:MAG: ribosomal L7Ae/L30e/S12e/Gadd45 family protein [Lachnospiraceae bacterium]|jgi:ribosomal protein L7Ae-like RNA K-turn-binding protein|nr:ribosomal L7Ae/L30e/S12e/Gadd45 family protein [Lachnospiraceae bacterium]
MAGVPKYLSSLGLAEKAGRVMSGELMTEKAVRSGKAKLVFVASDSSDNTKKKFTNLCDHYNVPVYFPDTKDVIGHAIGKEFRASLAVIDDRFAELIVRNINGEAKGSIGGNR